MIATSTDVVPYSKATEIASKYATATAEIRRLTIELGKQCDALREAFQFEDAYASDFTIKLSHHRNTYRANEQGLEQLMKRIQRAAWAVLVEKIGIKKLMSPKKREQLDYLLTDGRPRYAHEGEPEQLPEITAETIVQVMQGFIQSAPEYLEESIREVYRWLIPSQFHGGHVTNKRDRVGRKVIKTYAVEIGYKSNYFRPNYHRQADLTALDSIFHALDGKGILSGHHGPLVSAIIETEGGAGETEYFKFKSYKNGNLHIEFKRDDLLSLFNRVACDGHRLGGEAAR